MKTSTVVWVIAIGGVLVLGYLYLQQQGGSGAGP